MNQTCVRGAWARDGGGQSESHNDTGNEPSDKEEDNRSHNDLDAAAGRCRIATADTVHASTAVVPCTDVCVVMVSHLMLFLSLSSLSLTYCRCRDR